MCVSPGGTSSLKTALAKHGNGKHKRNVNISCLRHASEANHEFETQMQTYIEMWHVHTSQAKTQLSLSGQICSFQTSIL
jgi:hypothetical protein